MLVSVYCKPQFSFTDDYMMAYSLWCYCVSGGFYVWLLVRIQCWNILCSIHVLCVTCSSCCSNHHPPCFHLCLLLSRFYLHALVTLRFLVLYIFLSVSIHISISLFWLFSVLLWKAGLHPVFVLFPVFTCVWLLSPVPHYLPLCHFPVSILCINNPACPCLFCSQSGFLMCSQVVFPLPCVEGCWRPRNLFLNLIQH